MQGLWSQGVGIWLIMEQWRAKGGEIDIWEPENAKFSLGCPPPPPHPSILGQTIDRCILHHLNNESAPSIIIVL